MYPLQNSIPMLAVRESLYRPLRSRFYRVPVDEDLLPIYQRLVVLHKGIPGTTMQDLLTVPK